MRANFASTTTDVLITIDVDTTDAATGGFILSLDAADTTAAPIQDILDAAGDEAEIVAVGFWDMRIIESGETDGVYALEGPFSINRRISRT